MECPDLTNFQSLNKGQKRLDYAVESLGSDVVSRVMGFTLYILGYPYDYISKISGLSISGLKTLFQEINTNGVNRFQDKRKSEQSCLQNIDSDMSSVKYHENDTYAAFTTTGNISLKIAKDDILSKKLLSLFFMDAGHLKQKEVAEIMNCRRLSVHQNYLKLKSRGAKGLADNRGQKNDYKFNAEVKSEMLKKFISSVFDSEKPGKTNINRHLNETFLENYSERATALHLSKLGLTDIKNELISEIVRRTNERIDLLEYLKLDEKILESENKRCIIPLKKFKEGLAKNCLLSKQSKSNFFKIEQEAEKFISQLLVLVLESVLEEITSDISQCPRCNSNDVIVQKPDHTNGRKNTGVRTGLGSSLLFKPELLRKRKCNNCEKEFDIAQDILRISIKDKFTPRTQMKICAANRAGSYDKAVKNLNELLNLDINKNQVRKISNRVGEYIGREFDELYDDIKTGRTPEIIIGKHPLVEELKIDKKYLNSSEYLIILAADGGRMQLFDWIPSENGQSKGKKKLYWHESKVFRISIYDKKNLCNVTENSDNRDKKKYQSARIIPGLSTYGATNRKWEEVGPIIISHLYMRGIRPKDVEVCISDGSSHIMNKIFVPLFPDSVHILDYYHKNEALHKCLKKSGHNESGVQEKLKNFLWKGEINELVNELKRIQTKTGKPDKGKRHADDPKVLLDNFINHLTENTNRLRYEEFKKKKYPIGSGCIESAVKLFGKRIKGTEKQWNENGGESILNLYAFLLCEDERWNKLWEIQSPWIQ